MDNTQQAIILYDWLSFSAPDMTYEEINELLFSQNLPWTDCNSNRRYQYCKSWGHISIHYTVDCVYTDKGLPRHNFGVYVEMSGQGCREFEEVGTMQLADLLDYVVERGWHVSRLDVALDDKNEDDPLIDIESMASQALRGEFTTRQKKFKVDYSCSTASEDVGISVQHGSRSSNLYIRCYDKRCERGLYDECKHWVRLELQLRDDCCMGWLLADGSIGEKFRAVLANYLTYRDPSETDSNKRRWRVSDWWQKLLDGVAAISIATRCDREYNKSNLDRYVYDNCARAVVAAIVSDGLDVFVDKVIAKSFDVTAYPDKYKKVISMSTGKPADVALHKDLHAYYDDFLDALASRQTYAGIV